MYVFSCLLVPEQLASFVAYCVYFQGDGGLNIPTDLSPVKEGDVIPSRPSLSSANGSIRRR